MTSPTPSKRSRFAALQSTTSMEAGTDYISHHQWQLLKSAKVAPMFSYALWCHLNKTQFLRSQLLGGIVCASASCKSDFAMLDSFGFELILGCLHMSVRKNNRTPSEVPELQPCPAWQPNTLLSYVGPLILLATASSTQQIPSQAYQHVPQASSYLYVHKHVVSGNKQQSLI